MPDQALYDGYLATTRQGHGTLSSASSCHDYDTRQPGIYSSRPRQILATRPVRHQYTRRGTTSTSESVKMVPNAPEASRTSVSDHLRLTDEPGDFKSDCIAAHTHEKVKETLNSELEDSSSHTEWANSSPDDRMEQQPRTPRIRRLKTPELVPLHDGDRFCDCCTCSEVRYQKGRVKMDRQSEYLLLLCFVSNDGCGS